MTQARTVEAVERKRATVYVTYEIPKAQQNTKELIENARNKRIEVFNKGGNTFIRDG